MQFLAIIYGIMLSLLCMDNTQKQVYASIFLDENKLQILVGEYYNTRFNIIKSYREKIEGIKDFAIIDKEKVVSAIKKGIDEVSERVGASVKKVILVLPPVDFKRVPIRVSVKPTNGLVNKNDVARAISSSYNSSVGINYIIVNSSITKYYFNGVPSRRLPEKEYCTELLIDVDLLCANRDMCFSYVNLLNEAGLEVLDITLNNFAICKEAVLFEQSLVSNVILLDIGNVHSYISLISKGKLANCEILSDGMDVIYNFVKNCYDLPDDNLDRLIKYNQPNNEFPNDSVFAWNDRNGVNQSISALELSKAIKGPTDSLVDKVVTMCRPIIKNGNTSFFVVGEGSKHITLIETLKEQSGCDVKSYYPDTIGVRDSDYSAIYGSFFAYREKAILNNLSVNCVDVIEYEDTVNKKELNNEGETITTKILKMFEMYRDEEE